MSVVNYKKRKINEGLSKRVASNGVIISPCTECEKHESECEKHERVCVVMAADSARCSECIARSIKCDVYGPSHADWVSLEVEERRLRKENDRLQQERQEVLSRLLRLETLTKSNEVKIDTFRERASLMLRRGLKSLDELDALEEKERLENERVEREREQAGTGPLVPAAASSNVLNNFDPSSFLSSSDPFSFQNSSGPFWGDPDSVGEMHPTSQGS